MLLENLRVMVLLLRESTPGQVDKKSRVPKEEGGVWNSQGKTIIFFSPYIP